MPKESGSQKKTVGRVMREFKHGELKSRTGKAEAERRSRGGGPTRAELYEQATRRGIAGRPRMC